MRTNFDGVKVKEIYYKRSRRGKPVASYHSWADLKNRRVVKAVIKFDPILKKYPKYKKAVKQHELTEMKLRARGMSKAEAHNQAFKTEPKLIRGKSDKQLWKEMK